MIFTEFYLITMCFLQMKSTGDALNGYSYAIAALLGAVCKCPLGIPYSIGKVGE